MSDAIDLLPYQRALLVRLASPMVIRKPQAVGPSWGNSIEVVSGVVLVAGLRVPLTAAAMTCRRNIPPARLLVRS